MLAVVCHPCRFSGDVPAPIEVAVNAWGSDPLAQGTYVFSKVGALPDDARVLGAAAGNVHFAGEATSFEHPGYVHGAFESGERAAREVLAAIGM